MFCTIIAVKHAVNYPWKLSFQPKEEQVSETVAVEPVQHVEAPTNEEVKQIRENVRPLSYSQWCSTVCPINTLTFTEFPREVHCII